MLLEVLNGHARDGRIVFHEQEHFYEVDGKRYDTSVSGVVHHFFPQFDAKGTIERCYDHWCKRKDSKYFSLINYLRLALGFDDDSSIKAEIARLWTLNGRDKAGYGTSLHRCIELYLNNEPMETAEVPVEFTTFLEWRNTHPTWEPYRTEWSVFTEDFGVAGQIDSLWKDTQTGYLHMVDWKCVEKMEEKNSYKECGFFPFEDFPNTNLFHYVVQQNLYKYILESKYGLTVSTMRLVQLHKTCNAAKEWPLESVRNRTLMALVQLQDDRSKLLNVDTEPL